VGSSGKGKKEKKEKQREFGLSPAHPAPPTMLMKSS